jgi:hypothetical protein
MQTLPDPIIGTWKVNLAKSKFSPGPAPKSLMRTYTETPHRGRCGRRADIQGVDFQI